MFLNNDSINKNNSCIPDHYSVTQTKFALATNIFVLLCLYLFNRSQKKDAQSNFSKINPIHKLFPVLIDHHKATYLNCHLTAPYILHYCFYIQHYYQIVIILIIFITQLYILQPTLNINHNNNNRPLYAITQKTFS